METQIFRCQYCGKIYDYSERDYDIGVKMAQKDYFEAFGYEGDISAYIICKTCAKELLEEIKEN